MIMGITTTINTQQSYIVQHTHLISLIALKKVIKYNLFYGHSCTVKKTFCCHGFTLVYD